VPLDADHDGGGVGERKLVRARALWHMKSRIASAIIRGNKPIHGIKAGARVVRFYFSIARIGHTLSGVRQNRSEWHSRTSPESVTHVHGERDVIDVAKLVVYKVFINQTAAFTTPHA